MCATRQRPQARKLRLAEIREELLRLLGSDFQRPRKPTAKGSIQKRITHEEHKDDREQRETHGADNHFRFEARAELVFASFGPQANHASNEDEAEHEQRGDDETRNGIEGHDLPPIFRFKRNVEGPKRENCCEKKRKEDAADRQAPSLLGFERTHDVTAT